MGLIKAAVNAVGGTLRDTWEDYIKCDSLDNNVLVTKVTTKTGVISNKSRIQVSPGQVALIFDSGKILVLTSFLIASSISVSSNSFSSNN